MSEWLKLVLTIAAAGVVATLAATLGARWFSESRRLARTFRQGLGAAPDAWLVGHGTGRGVALSLATRRIVCAWDGGAWRMTYPLDELLGAELDLDGHVSARAMRGQPRRMLDRQSGAEDEVRLRMLFDEPRHPDFEIVLWPCRAGQGAPTRPREAVAEANRWIARVEALLRRSGGALALNQTKVAAKPRAAAQKVSAPAQPPPWEDEPELFDEADLDEEEDDALAE